MAKLTVGRLPICDGEAPARAQFNELIRILDGAFLQLDTDAFRLGHNETPASTSDTGTIGTIKYDDDYIYICIDTDTWKRAAISTW